MSSLTLPPDHLLTLDEWDALPEDLCRNAELVEGVVVMSPAPTVRHQLAVSNLIMQLKPQLRPMGLDCVPSPDVLIFEDGPPTMRSPDLVVADRSVVRAGPKRLRADEVVLAIEIVSPGSRRTDRIGKLADYAEAGIAEYWIVDLDDPLSVETMRLVDGRYEATSEPLVPIEAGTLLD